MGWNGLDLLNDFSAELGDTSAGFKTKVLRWINEGIRDIATTHNWPHLREKGQALFEAGTSSGSIALSKPSAPVVAALAGGALATATTYKVLVTFFEGVSEVESIAGLESDAIIPSGPNLAIRLSDIPVSTNPLVTARKVYVSKANGAFQYYGAIPHNLEELPGTPDPLVDPPTPVTYDIMADTASLITPPDNDAIHMIDGDLFLEGSRNLDGRTVQDIIYQSNGVDRSGTPQCWAPVNEEEVRLYPKPSVDTLVSFYYFKLPARIFATASSIPQIKAWLYDDLRRYVMWRGYDFRDRAGKESKEITYRENLKITVSRKGKALKRSGRVRCKTPDSDGMVY